MAQVQVVRISHVIHACSKRHSSTLSSPFHPTSFFLIHLQSYAVPPALLHNFEGNNSTAYFATKEMEFYDESYFPTGYEPNAYDLKKTYVETFTESLKQWFLEDVDYDDTAFEKMLHKAH